MDVTWPQIPIGVGIAVLLFRELARFLRERNGKVKTEGMSGSRSTDYWEAKIAELMYRELERHVIPRLKEIIERQVKMWDTINSRTRNRD